MPGVWSFGDAVNHFQLKHMCQRRDACTPPQPDARQRPSLPGPRARTPRCLLRSAGGSVGLTEQQATDRGIAFITRVRQCADTAFGWALEDTSSVVKLLADPQCRTLIGAHIIGPQAATLLQPLLQAMVLGQKVNQLAHDVLYVHPALTEVVEQALLGL